MAEINKIPVTWNGLTALPGVSVFYSTSASTTAVAAIKAFFTAIKGFYPPNLTWNVPSNGDRINELDGKLGSTWSMAGGGSVSGSSGTSAYAAGTGLRVVWRTTQTIHGRRMRGSTFLCPIVSAQYEVNGTIVDATVASHQTAANALVADGTILIWSRPWHPDPPQPNNPDRNGVGVGISAAVVPDQVTSLRSRRV